jgi:exosortase A
MRDSGALYVTSPLGRAHWVRLAPAALPLLLGLGALLAIFHEEAWAAVKIWSHSTAYGHCFLVLPLALWLAYERRNVVLGLAITPASPRIALWLLPLAAGWIVSYVLGIMEGRQLIAMAAAQLLFYAVLGRDLYVDLSAPLLFLVFMVPFGAFLTPVLQNFTADFILLGLKIAGIPFRADTLHIEIPEGTFYVAEACAGLRFLIASVAFGALYALTMYRSTVKRVAFIAASSIVPIFANGVRGLGIVMLGHVLGSAEAAAADHLIYGWVFFSMVTFALALGGLPFREDLDIEPAPRSVADFARGALDRHEGRQASPGSTRMAGLWVAASITGIALIGPLIGIYLDRRTPDLAVSVVPEPAIPGGCVPGRSVVSEGLSVQSFDCGDAKFTMTTQVFARGSNPAKVIGSIRSIATDGMDADMDQSVMHIDAGMPDEWVMLSENNGRKASAYVFWLDGSPALGSIRDRIRLARAMFATDQRPALGIVIAVDADRAVRARRLREFVSAQDQLADQISKQLGSLATQ